MLETITGHRSLPEHERKRGGSQREPASAFKPRPPPRRARADAKAVLVGDGCVAATKPHTSGAVLLALGKVSLTLSFLSCNVLEGYPRLVTVFKKLLLIQGKV